MKAVSEENAKMTKQNAEATLRMSQLAESGNRQAEQSARQAKSMEALTIDAKRDTEIMKTITVVTMIFLPPTFVSVCPELFYRSPAQPLPPDNLQYGLLPFRL
jgi:Mg2+ and Co2+ transporter CorA